MTTVPVETIRRKQAGRRARAAGEALEVLALRYLAARGVLAQRIATPSVVRGGRKCHTAKVVGDLVGVGIGGRSVIVECKSRQGRRPRPSDFLDHQRETLADWHKAGALVLVAYINSQGVLTVENAMDILNPKASP